MKKIMTMLSVLAFPLSSYAADVEIGKAVEKNGMHIAAVYIQPVKMEPEHGTGSDKADIHLEADIAALKDNPNGFAEGSWVPYLTVRYRITQEQTGWKTKGTLMPMVASDGPHYGDNVALNGAGKYRVVFAFTPPSGHSFMRHVDKETGVAPWWEPFELEYDFAWIGSTGKKGGY